MCIFNGIAFTNGEFNGLEWLTRGVVEVTEEIILWHSNCYNKWQEV